MESTGIVNFACGLGQLGCVPSLFQSLIQARTRPQMIVKAFLTLVIALLAIGIATADEKPQRIADSIKAKIFTTPFMSNNITLDITQDSTLYLLPGENAIYDFSSAYSFYGSNRQWIWIVDGRERQPSSQPSWQGSVPDYNPLEYPKATMQLKLRNSAGDILTPVITVTLMVSPKITTALPESMTVTEGEETEISVGVNTDQRTLFTWGVNNKTFPDHDAKIKFVPTLEMDGKTLGVLALNFMGVATSTTVLHVKMAPWKIALIVIFVVLAVGGLAAGAVFFLKKKGYIGKNTVEYVNTQNPKGKTEATEDDNGLLESDEDI